jgi:hypothetical protein
MPFTLNQCVTVTERREAHNPKEGYYDSQTPVGSVDHAVVCWLGQIEQSQSQSKLCRTVDIVQLLGSGMCFGATMVGLILGLMPQDR